MDTPIKQTIDAALKCFRILETEIDRGDNYRIGAALAELRRELNTLAGLANKQTEKKTQ
jgi:hypothetical protein